MHTCTLLLTIDTSKLVERFLRTSRHHRRFSNHRWFPQPETRDESGERRDCGSVVQVQSTRITICTNNLRAITMYILSHSYHQTRSHQRFVETVLSRLHAGLFPREMFPYQSSTLRGRWYPNRSGTMLPFGCSPLVLNLVDSIVYLPCWESGISGRAIPTSPTTSILVLLRKGRERYGCDDN